jgi:hypothetical protein
MPAIHINLKPRGWYFRDSVRLPYGGGRKFRASLGPCADKKGVYVIFDRPGKAAYVGQTSGRKVDFGVRLYRHVNLSAAGPNSTVCVWLRRTPKAQVTFLPVPAVLEHFTGSPQRPSNRIATLLLERALVFYLRPSLQKKAWL